MKLLNLPGHLAAFHMMAVLSTDTEAKNVSCGDQETSKISPSWPRKLDTQRHHSTFTTFDPNTEPPAKIASLLNKKSTPEDNTRIF